jgi:hypothetical protein
MKLCSSGLDLLREIRFGVGLGVVSIRPVFTRAHTTSQIKTSIFNEVKMLFKAKKPSGLFQEDNASSQVQLTRLAPKCGLSYSYNRFKTLTNPSFSVFLSCFGILFYFPRDLYVTKYSCGRMPVGYSEDFLQSNKAVNRGKQK